MYRCIRFNLYDINNDTTIAKLESEIKMSFVQRAQCELRTEEYKRSYKNMFVVIEIFGDKNIVEHSIKETKYYFNKWCKEVTIEN